MSYILNALRKSEQARQVKQTPTLENSIMHSQTEQPKRKYGLMFSILAINIIILLIFFWWYQQEHASSSTPMTDEQAVAATLSPEQLIKQRQLSHMQQEQLTATAEDPQSTAKQQYQSAAIAEMINQRRLDNMKKRPPPLAKMPISMSTPANTNSSMRENSADLNEYASNPPPRTSRLFGNKQHQSDSTEVVKTEHTEKPTTVANEIIQAVRKQASQAKAHAAVQPRLTTGQKTAVQATEQLALLKDLPYSFRRQVPKLNLNVYVYAEQPIERFIMVDMVRYQVGEEIAEGLQLQEILADGLVVNFSNKTFKIKRP